MKRIYSLTFKIPAIISIMSLVLIFIMLITSIHFASEGIKEGRFDGFRNLAKSYSQLFDFMLMDQISFANSYSVAPIVIQSIDNTDENIKIDLLKTLKLFNAENIYASNILVVDLDGNIILDALGNSGENIKNNRENFWNRLKSNNFQYALDDKIVKSKYTLDNSFILGSGIKNSQNIIIGAILVELDWKTIHNNYFTDIDLGKTGRLLVIDKNLIDIMDNLYDSIGSTVVQEYRSVFNSSLIEGTLSYLYQGKKRTGSFYKMKSMDWIVAVTMFDSEIYEKNTNLILVSSIVGIFNVFLLSLFVYLFIKRIMINLDIVIKEAKEIEIGNLHYIGNMKKRKDEIGILYESFNNMREKLKEIISTVNESSVKISSAAQELAVGNDDLSRRTESQAASLEETASSMEEMASTIKSSTEHSIEGNNMMKESMNSIRDAGTIVMETTQSIEEVSEYSEKIKNITKVIEDIAFQTNILALNAAVEAARAGEQGKGFAVVASEVRNLAQNSQVSAKDITSLINLIYEKINKSAEKAKASQQIFEDLEKKIEETSNIMKDISETAVEQQSGVDQVNNAVAQMDSVTQQNATLVQESADASNSLLNEAKVLEDTMGFFKL